MVVQSVLRLFRFRPAGSGVGFDAAFRESTLPGVRTLEGLLAFFAGRRGPDEAGERVWASLWESKAAMEAARGEQTPGELFDLERGEDMGSPRLEVLPLALHIVPAQVPAQPASILRVFRGDTRPGELDQYVEEAREGTLADIARGHGPLGLFLAELPPTRFVTMSVWPDWASIELATGGNVRKPIRTRNAARLITGTATHYEVLPDSPGRANRSALPADELRLA